MVTAVFVYWKCLDGVNQRHLFATSTTA